MHDLSNHKKFLIISFIIGLFLGIVIMYAFSNRYVSYQSKGNRIVRIDKWTGKTYVSNVYDLYPKWRKVDED